MKRIQNLKKEFDIPEFNCKQRIVFVYFTFSFFALFVADDTAMWIIILLILNFAISIIVAKKLLK